LRAFGREDRQLAGQRRTKIILHRHPKNPALNKRETTSSSFFCNRSRSVVTFQPLKKILHRPRYFFRPNKRWWLCWDSFCNTCLN